MILEPRQVPLGGLRALNVWRTLPYRDLPTIGAWCFVDHFGPTHERMTVLPHPHIGLQTVTWPIAGDIRHRDNLGNDVVLRPTELNLMTAGNGVSHSEFSVSDADMHGIQLWLAQPEASRHGPASFEHIADLPRVSGEHWRAIVLVGALAGTASTATVHSPVMAAEIRLDGRAELSLDPRFEHGVLAVSGDIRVNGESVAHRHLQYLPTGGDAVTMEADEPTTAFIIGGEPFEEPLVMWWNFIGRTHEDVVVARDDWEAQRERYGHVDGHGGQIIPAPPMPPLRLKPRVRRA